MNYSKPEVVVLGAAAVKIEGSQKQTNPDPISGFQVGLDCELDD